MNTFPRYLVAFVCCFGFVFLNIGELKAQVNCGGCTDPTACNYNPSATEDDGSCISTPDCGLWAADDILCINEGENLSYNVLCNDNVSDFPFVIEAQGNDCFSISENGDVIQNNLQDIDCCGEHFIPYTIFFQDGTQQVLQANLRITVKCGKPDCSIIDLETVIGSPVGDGGLSVVDCFDVCENSVSTLQYPFNPSFSYDWTGVIGGVGSPGANPAELIVSWNNFGSGFVSLDVYDGNGNLTSFNFCVNILEGPVADFSSAGYVCLDSPICFTNLSSNADSYQWDFGDGVVSNMSDPCHTYSSPGTYTVTLTATKANFDAEGNPLCCCTDVTTASVVVDDLPGPNIYWISTLCEGDNSDYWTDAANCGSYLWTVEDADGNPVLFTGQGTPDINVTWGAGPVGTVTLAVTDCDDDYCSNPTSVTVPIISANGTIDGSDAVCEFSTQTYCVPKWQSTVYNWTITGGSIVSSPDGNCITVVWGPAGAGTLHVDYSSAFLAGLPNHSAGDCEGSADLTVNIIPSYDVINTGPSVVCVGDVSNIITSSSPNPNCTWNISPAHPFTGDGTDQISINWTTPGTYIIEAVPVNPMDYCNGPESIIIQVQDIPAPTAIDGNISVCPNSTHYYSIPSPNPSYSYFWSTTNGTPVSGTGTSIGVTWDNIPGPFSLTVYAQSNGTSGCQSEDFTINIEPKTIDGPLAISPDVACSNTISSHSLTPMQDDDAIITWSVVPAVAGSVLVQNDENTQIQWNDWSGNAQIFVEVELCGNTVSENITVPVNQAIVPVITQSGVLCTGSNATLSTTVPFSSYDWSTFDTSPTTVISSQGNYAVTTVDGNGCVATSSFDANEIPGPSASISTGNNTTICLSNPHTVTLIAQFNANFSYQWYCGGVLVPGATGDTYDHPFQGVAGSYPYWVVVTDNTSGCMNTSDTIVVNESTCPPNPCTPEPHSFNITTAQNQATNCNVIDFETTTSNATFSTWSFGDGALSGLNPTSHTYTTAGCYNVIATGSAPDVNGNGNCSVNDQVTVCVPVAAEFDFAFLSCTIVQFNEFATFINTDPANTIVSYLWDFDGFGTSTAMNPSFDFALPIPPGNHPVTLTVTTDGGCQASITHDVFIDSVGATAINVVPGPTCVGDPIAMSASASGATTYDWDFGDLSYFLGASTTHTYTAPGNYTITVVSTNAAGCSSSTSIPITIFPAIPDLSITASPDLAICEGQTTTLSAPPGYAYQWSNGMTTQSISVSAGLYSVLITDGNGCESELEEVEVTELPLPDASISGNTFICDAGCSLLSAPSGVGLSYEWYDALSNSLDTGSQINVCTPLLSNQFFVEITDQNGCKNVSAPFDVFQATSPSFSVTVAPNGCAGELNTLSVVPVQPGVSYVWSDGTTGPSMTTTQAGTYYVTATDDATGCSFSSQGTVNPQPDLCLVPVGCYTACEPYELCAPIGFVSYQWNLDGNPIPGATMPCYTATMSGTYTVTAMNSFGCYDTSGLLVLEIIPCNGCEDVSVSSTPAVNNNEPDPCCFDLHYSNGYSGPLQGLSVYTSDSDFAFDVASINPLLGLTGSTSNSVDLISITPGSPIPTGTLNNVISLCLENVVNSPQTVYIDWYDFDNEVVCQDSLIFDCPVEPDCLYLSDQDIYCENGQTVYEFTVCNPNDADWPVAYFSMDAITPGFLVSSPSDFTPSPAIAPGSCQSFTAILSGPGIGGEVFCFNLIAHEFDPLEVPNTECCSLDTLYCIDIPPCDPCEDVGVFDVTSTDPDDCCLSVDLFNNYSSTFFDEIAVCAITPSTTLTVGNYIGSGWTTSNYTGTSFSLIPDATFGNFVPGGNFTLPEICAQTSVAPPQLMEIKWMVEGEVVCRDTIANFCEPDCAYFQDEIIECNQNTWNWSANIKNTSDFVVSEAVINFNDPALAAYNQVVSTGSLAPGATFGPINLSIGSPALAGQTICFTVTIHEIGSNGQYLSCCNFEHCITLPDCGFASECSCDESFFDAVNLGFTTASIGPNTLGFTMTDYLYFGECDIMYWKFGDGTPIETSLGNQSIIHTYPGPGIYTVCVRVYRTAADGSTCVRKVCTEIFVPSAFGLEDLITVFPNPNNGDFKIAINQALDEGMDINIYDGTQRLIHSRSLSSIKEAQVQRFDLKEYGKGLYFIHFRRGNELHIEKIIVF